MYEMVTGQSPFKGPGPVEVLNQQLAGAPLLRTVLPDVPERLEAIVDEALQFDPADRFQTPAGMLQAIDSLLKALNSGEDDGDLPPPEAREQFDRIFEQRRERPISITIVGRMHVGKSSTISRLIGWHVPLGKFERGTPTVKKYTVVINGVEFHIFDTPGLCDDLAESGNDDEYIKEMRKEFSDVDLLLYVTRLDFDVVSLEEKRAIQLITKAFEPQIWAKAIVAFSWSRNVKPEEFADYRRYRPKFLMEEIHKSATKEFITERDCVFIDNKDDLTDEGLGLRSLWIAAAQRISESALIDFLESQKDRLQDLPHNDENSGSQRGNPPPTVDGQNPSPNPTPNPISRSSSSGSYQVNPSTSNPVSRSPFPGSYQVNPSTSNPVSRSPSPGSYQVNPWREPIHLSPSQRRSVADRVVSLFSNVASSARNIIGAVVRRLFG